MGRKEVRVCLSEKRAETELALRPIVRQIIEAEAGPFPRYSPHATPEEKKVRLTMAGLEEILYRTIFEADPLVMEIELCEGPFGITPTKRICRGEAIATVLPKSEPEPASEKPAGQPFPRLAGVPRSQRFRGGQR